jgi:formaldehyde-activating enzyme involved in methanogenesis
MKKVRKCLILAMVAVVIGSFVSIECAAADKVYKWRYNSLWPVGLALFQ